MTKEQLIAKINDLPDDIVFLISKDEEGNEFRKLTGFSPGWGYHDGYEWEVLHPDDYKEYIDSGDILTKVVVVW